MAVQHIRFDWAIKKLLRNKANFEILEGFLSVLLKFDVLIENIIESSSNKETFLDKSNAVDILVKNPEGELILIEVQNEREHDYFHRMNYGQAKLISENINSGETYREVKKVYSINIVYFDLGQGDDYVYVGRTDFKGLHTETLLDLSVRQKELYPAKTPADIFATYYILKINKFNKVAEDSLDQWIYFFKNSEIPDNFEARGLQKAKEALRIDSLNSEEKEAYENFIKTERVRQNELETAVYDATNKLKLQFEIVKIREQEEKRQKEEAQNREKEALLKQQEERRQKEEAIKNLYKVGIPIAVIATSFQKTETEILAILNR